MRKRRELLWGLLDTLTAGRSWLYRECQYKTMHGIESNGIEIIVNMDDHSTVGTKRNDLLNEAKGKYLCYIDDDDSVSSDYIKHLLEGIRKDVDCCSLLGEYSEEGKFIGMFEHSIKYKEYRTVPSRNIRFERYPNHLNCIRASIAKRFRFPEKNHGEDTDWATQIFKSGLLKTEHHIPEVIYYYLWQRKQ